MNPYQTHSIQELLSGNPYPGRGILIGRSADGKHGAVAYFIMGRSENSRNRIFEATPDGIRTRAWDESRVSDPSLIIYHPVRRLYDSLIVTNGDQTDTIRDGLLAGRSFSQALETRSFEPDGPNWTPRISALLALAKGDFSFQMSLLKSADPAGTACDRFTYAYAALPGLGRFLHTYVTDGSPLPPFTGEPERVAVGNDPEEFTGSIWDSLDGANKISLYTNWIDLASGQEHVQIINKHH